MTWKSPDNKPIKDYKVEYGLGIFRMKTPFGYAYNHSGDGIGYYATMSYFPDQKVAISWATNGNYGKLDDISQLSEAIHMIFETVFKDF